MSDKGVTKSRNYSRDIYDRKLDALEDLIEAANGKPVLVAYWFRHDLARISERLNKLHIPFSQIDTPESIRKWNAGELPVALVHPASAGHGLNLPSGGSAIIWFGLTWSLELYQQTNARLWRQGQCAETVVIQHIVAKGTIDERMANCIVLDPFGGSGSTLIASEQTDRICFMVELDERYCDVIVRRFCQNFPDQPVFRNGERVLQEEITKTQI